MEFRKDTLIKIFYAVLAVIGGYLFFKYLFFCFLPFLLAFIIASSTKGIITKLSQKLKVNRIFSVLIIDILIIAVIFSFLYFLIYRMFSELSGLSVFFRAENVRAIISNFGESVKSMLKNIAPEISHRITDKITSLSQNLDILAVYASDRLIPFIAQVLIKAVKSLPQFFFFAGVMIISVFYFSCDYDRIISFIKMQLNDKSLKIAVDLKNQFFVTVINIIRAYAILIVMTFLELWTGLTLMGFKYTTVISALTALVDILPVLGTGTVLVPWSIALFLSGNTKNALCIIALYVIITVVRQIAEPKILGDSVGIHPLITIMSMYLGVKILGGIGLFIFPFTVIIIKNLNEKGSIHLYNNPQITPSTKKLTKGKQRQ